MQNPFEHSCWRRRRPGDKPVMEGWSDHTEPTYRAGYGEDTCPACAYEQGVRDGIESQCYHPPFKPNLAQQEHAGETAGAPRDGVQHQEAPRG